MNIKHIITRRLVAVGMLFPAMVINYLAVVILLNVFHFQGFWVLSAVLVGDIIGFGVNSSIIELNMKILMRFKAFRVLTESEEKYK